MLIYLGSGLYEVYTGDEKRQLTKEFLDELLELMKESDDFGYDGGYDEGYADGVNSVECNCDEDWGDGFDCGKEKGSEEAEILFTTLRKNQDKEIKEALRNLSRKVGA